MTSNKWQAGSRGLSESEEGYEERTGSGGRGPAEPLHLASRPLFLFSPPATRRDSYLSLPGVMLSLGFGFVEYRKPEQAQKALKQLQVKWGFSAEAQGVTWGERGCQPSETERECREVHAFSSSLGDCGSRKMKNLPQRSIVTVVHSLNPQLFH